MKTKTKYTAKQPDSKGHIAYTAEENAVWKILYDRQIALVQRYACPEYCEGLEIINMPKDRVPQLADISNALRPLTGWSVVPVPALITAEAFFTLLANKQFPAATFIRIREELDYLEEPDIFHEFFGHCPMLTNKIFADFMQKYGELTLSFPDEKDRELLARLFWFTVEFGLIQTKKGPRPYGGGILSSFGETQYCVDDAKPERQSFDVLNVLRTPYRIDIMQTVYFVIQNFEELFDLVRDRARLAHWLSESKRLGEFAPTFPTQKYSHENDEWVTC